jgi:hypothetical protein
MTTRSTHHEGDDIPFVTPVRTPRWKRLLVAVSLATLALLILVRIVWSAFFHYVPPGKMLVIISNNGVDLPPGQVLADEGQKGIQKAVLGEGWHYVTPILYSTELKPNTVIKSGHLGILVAKGGVPPRDGRVLAEQDDEQGIRRQVLLPGAYRLNPYGFDVEEVKATVVAPGYVGVMRRLLGKDSTDRFAHGPEEKGILREVLQPGMYYINTKEYEVRLCEVGIDQTTYRYDPAPQRSTAITFPARDGNTISMDCTIEWEVRPNDWPDLVAEYGDLHVVERNVVDQHARKISRDRGFNYGAQDFLEGEKREKFQTDFTEELMKVCQESKVVVRSAFIRDMVIPENFLKQKRDRQLAVETKVTSEALTETAQTEAEVTRAQKMIDQAEAKVKAETERLVAGIDRETENIKIQTEAEIEGLKAKYGAQIAELEAERTRLLGKAESEAKTLTETAKSNIFKLKLEVFQNDGNAYLRSALAEKLNKDMVLRIYQSGPGTLWTNLGSKNMNLLLPMPGAGISGRLGGGEKPSLNAKPMTPAE